MVPPRNHLFEQVNCPSGCVTECATFIVRWAFERSNSIGGRMMVKPNKPTLLAIYRKTLARYEAEGDVARAEIQKRLIERLEAA